MEFIYEDDGNYYFMDTETYEQIFLTTEQISDYVDFIVPQIQFKVYFHDENPDIHINTYPNINFIYDESGIQFTVTGEVQSSFIMILRKIMDHPKKFSKIANKLTEFNFFIYLSILT